MMTVGGNPFRIARPSRVQRSALRDWLLRAGAVLGATIFAMGVSSSAWARKSAPLATTVWVANSGALNAGSLETFAAGSKKNSKPQYRNVGQQSLLEFLPIPGGSIVAAVNPAGVALTPDSNHVSVVGQLVFLNSILGPTGAMLTYTPTANGDVPPETIILGPDTGLGLPGGDAYGPGPFFLGDSQQQILLPFNELYVTNAASSIDGNGAVTEYPEGAGGSSLADPNIDAIPDEAIGGDPAVTFLAEPVGVYVDTTTAELCESSGTPIPAAPPFDYCDTPGTTIKPLGPTRQIWVVNRFLGLVSIFLPEAACDISPYNPTAVPPVPGFCPGQSLNTSLPNYVAQQPPLGGAFFTTEDALPTPPAGGGTTDTTNPNYIAVQRFAPPCSLDRSFSCPEVYVTDLAGGFKGRGRIKFFKSLLSDTCLIDNGNPTATPPVPATICFVALRGSLFGAPDGTIEGKTTRLAKVMGIAAQPAVLPVTSSQSAEIGEPDNLFVTNVDGNSIEQFSSLERDNVPPDAFVRGRRTKMNQPSGLAVTAPPSIISSPGNNQ